MCAQLKSHHHHRPLEFVEKKSFLDQNLVSPLKYTHANSMQLSIYTECIKFMNCFIKQAWMQSYILHTWRIAFNPLLFVSHSLRFNSVRVKLRTTRDTQSWRTGLSDLMSSSNIFSSTFFPISCCSFFIAFILNQQEFHSKKMHLIKISIYLKSCRAFKAWKNCLPSKREIHIRVDMFVR